MQLTVKYMICRTDRNSWMNTKLCLNKWGGLGVAAANVRPKVEIQVSCGRLLRGQGLVLHLITNNIPKIISFAFIFKHFVLQFIVVVQDVYLIFHLNNVNYSKCGSYIRLYQRTPDYLIFSLLILLLAYKIITLYF